MESPPSVSTHSDVPPLSEDSGLLLTSGSISSDSASGWHYVNSELQESDYDEKSLSLCGSTETFDRMCGNNFNTVKKGPSKVTAATIEPPPEFQDLPTTDLKRKSKRRSKSVQVHLPRPKTKSATLDVPLTLSTVSPTYGISFNRDPLYERRQCHRFASPGLLHLSPCRGNSPSSKNSFSSRLSSSHNSLVTQLQTDDSNLITQAISHDTLLAKSSDIMDMYNVPFDSDIYAVPIDMVKTGQNCVRRSKKHRFPRKRKTASHTLVNNSFDKQRIPKDTQVRQKSKRHSLPSSSRKSTAESDSDSLHMTLKEMRKYLQALYSSSSESDTKNNTININSEKNKCDAKTSVYNDTVPEAKVFLKEINEGDIKISLKNIETNNNKCNKTGNAKNRKHKEKEQKCVEKCDVKDNGNEQKGRIFRVGILSMNLKQSLCKWFRWRRDGERGAGAGDDSKGDAAPAPVRRALPPLPQTPLPATRSPDEENVTDFATSIQIVKDYGWYWGPISVEAAEKILSNEPDGSFIVRDSSDDHYIFTLTFKLNGLRHVRIEHDQGNFCFGGCSMFKAQTIVEFIENAVETSRNGRYLFFLNLRPGLGPVRVQLLHPVSRFRRVQSLQHMCRFVILKNIRRDKISQLPLPRRIIDYLNASHFYSELLADL